MSATTGGVLRVQRPANSARDAGTRASLLDRINADNADNAAIARRVLDHAGVGDRVTVVVGTLGDAYLADLERIRQRGWLRGGAVVVADNVKFPGVPGYREHMRGREGREWRTIEHERTSSTERSSRIWQSSLSTWCLPSGALAKK